MYLQEKCTCLGASVGEKYYKMNIRITSILFAFIAVSSLLLMSCDSSSNRARAKLDTEDSVETAGAIMPTPAPVPSPAKISTSHFYFENSGSMDGYVNGNSSIKVALSRLLYGLEAKSEYQKFYFFNTKAHPQKEGTKTKDFIGKLTLKGIQVGDKSTSDLNLILETVLNTTEDNEVSVLVTDGIYSMDSKGDLLGQLQVAGEGTYYQLKKRLERSNIQTVLVKLESQFDGFFFPAKGGRVKINQIRPYYVWIYGSPDRIASIKKEVEFTDLPGYLNHAIFQANQEETPDYSIHTSYAKKGEFRNDRSRGVGNQETSLIYVEKDRHSGDFQFAVGVDMKKVTAEESYILNPTNYKVSSNKYQIKEIVPAGNLIGKDANEIQGTPISHLIVLNTSSYPVDNLEVSLSNKLPTWISETHTSDDSKIHGDTKTTFGFQYLVDGIARAYQKQASSQEYFNISVNIKKQ